MGKWVVTVAGIAILSVLCDVILPEGQTRKYVKTVFGVVVSLVIIQPIVGLFSTGVSSDVIDFDSAAPQEQYLTSVADRQNEYALKTVKQLLEYRGISVKGIQLNSSSDVIYLQLGVEYSADSNAVVEQVVAAYFPKTEIVATWSNL